MKLPKMIPIGGINYQVETVSKPHSDLEGERVACINYHEARIRIWDELDPQVQFWSLCHEVVHGILFAMANDLHSDEQFVEGFAAYLHQLLTQTELIQ